MSCLRTLGLSVALFGWIVVNDASAQTSSLFGSQSQQAVSSTGGSSSSRGSTGTSMTGGSSSRGGTSSRGGSSGFSGIGTGNNLSGIGTGGTSGGFGNQTGQTSGFIGRGDTSTFIGGGQLGQSSSGNRGSRSSGGSNTSYGRYNSSSGFGGGGAGGFGSTGTSESKVIRPRLRIAFSVPELNTAEVRETLNAQIDSAAGRGIPVEGVSVDLSDQGRVTLRGVVNSEDTRKLAEIMVRIQPGVSSVRNELTVQPATPAP